MGTSKKVFEMQSSIVKFLGQWAVRTSALRGVKQMLHYTIKGTAATGKMAPVTREHFLRKY
jgi:hypothetical protein